MHQYCTCLWWVLRNPCVSLPSWSVHFLEETVRPPPTHWKVRMQTGQLLESWESERGWWAAVFKVWKYSRERWGDLHYVRWLFFPSVQPSCISCIDHLVHVFLLYIISFVLPFGGLLEILFMHSYNGLLFSYSLCQGLVSFRLVPYNNTRVFFIFWFWIIPWLKWNSQIRSLNCCFCWGKILKYWFDFFQSLRISHIFVSFVKLPISGNS